MPAQTETGSPKPRPHWLHLLTYGRNPRTTLIRAAILVIVCYIVFFSHLVLWPVQVEGISMQPTYKDRSVNFINRWAYFWHEPRRGDVVMVRGAAGIHDGLLIKRIIGLPGETVAFDNGRVLINGQPLAEPYEKWRCDWTLPPRTLGTNEYFIVGDNRTMRWQDHTFGKVDRSRIMGKALL